MSQLHRPVSKTRTVGHFFSEQIVKLSFFFFFCNTFVTFYFRDKLVKGINESSHQRNFLAHVNSDVPKVFIAMSCY